jgi:2-polyprenyl-6-hydroxyphenyl methylase/3-demethylubiquinone-9 3-methyltransferase
LEDAGLRPVAWRSAYIIPHKFPALPSSGKEFYRLESLTLIDKALGRIFPWNRLGWSLMVKAEKAGRLRDPIKQFNNSVLEAWQQ